MKILVRFIILFLSSIITISVINYPLINLAKMTEEKPKTTAVEVNGIRFETQLKNSVISMSSKKEKSLAEMKFEVIITNNTSTTFYFNFGDNLMPQMVASDGQRIFSEGSSDWTDSPKEYHFLLSKPGETVTFLDSAIFIYLEEEFLLLFKSQRGTSWGYRLCRPGTYQLEFVYKNSETMVKAETNEGGEDKIIENIWTGEIALPVLEFQLVDESI